MWCASEVNPICGDCFANSAICWHRVDTISSSDALGMFPPSRPTTRRPLPSPFPGNRVPVVRVPLLRRYYETLRLPVVLPAVLRFLRLAVPLLAPVFVSPQGPAPAKGPGTFGSGSSTTPAFKEMETTGSPRFLENPDVPLPCSPTPAGPTHQAISMRRHGPRSGNDEGSKREVISGLNRTASALTVYASPGGSPAQDARLVSGCWPSSPRRD